ncbi:hypothetical protein Ccrd_021340 [Cynara cardunculus var. scolymus]|uniref:Embryo sac development arrest 6 n=1 Tax=Cynara cardunculus var. scolymus TaxID=59895 RepID=A0A103Y0Q2_CYNCS|nr:hypothetical protein Ccrd_021340 [Cynara cardunculus var. scolymus]
MNEQRSYGMMNPGASRLKRKDRESVFPAIRSPQPPPQKLGRATTVTASTTIPTSKGMSSHKLLAGYMAYEFLTKGTLLGQKFESTVQNQNQSGIEAETEKWRKGKESYKEITSLMMVKSDGGGIHIPGIVNPTQLGRWIQM